MATKSPVRKAAAKAAKPAKVSLAQTLSKTIKEQAPAFGVLLPQGAERERFELQLVTAVKANPRLLECLKTAQGQVSLILAARQAASLGLELNTLRHEASLEPRRNGPIDECRLNIEWRGYVKLAEEATGGKISASVIRENDDFEYGYSLAGDYFKHEPAGDDSELTGAWARIRYTDGAPPEFVVMTREAIEKRRAMSETWRSDQKKGTAHSPWTKWEPEQYLKTAIRTLCKRINLSTTVATAIASDGARLEIDDEGGVPSIAPVEFVDEDQPALAAPDKEPTDPGPSEEPTPEEASGPSEEELDPGRPFE